MSLKISELEKITGVPQSTIRYYVKEGLLPKPEKVNKSMSYYDESCIDRIALVIELKEKKYYPLSVIRNIIKSIDKGASLNGLISLRDAIFSPKVEGEQILMDRDEFLKASGMDKEHLKQAEEMKILIPFNKGGKKPYNHEDLNFARHIVWGYKELKTDVTEMKFYVELGEKIVEKEISLRKRIVSGKSKDENIKITARLSERADEMRGYILRRLFQTKVRKMIEKV
jgi:DNA-binding transcriptional MerR regulator